MSDYADIELDEPKRGEVLERVRAQIADWGLRMPDVEPVALHFGLNDFERVGETEFWIANEKDRGYCGKFLFVFEGQTCPYHFHKKKHETFFVLKGSIRMKTQDGERVMNEGDLLTMPPGTGHSFTGTTNALLLEVSMPSTLNDNFFEDRRIGKNGVI